MKAEIFCPHCQSKRTVALPVRKGVRTCRRCGEAYKIPSIPLPEESPIDIVKETSLKPVKIGVNYREILAVIWKFVSTCGKYAFWIIRAPFLIIFFLGWECWFRLEMLFTRPGSSSSLPQSEIEPIPASPRRTRSRKKHREPEEEISEEELARLSLRLSEIEAEQRVRTARAWRPVETFEQRRRRMLGYDEAPFRAAQQRAMFSAGAAFQRNQMIDRMNDIGDDLSDIANSGD